MKARQAAPAVSTAMLQRAAALLAAAAGVLLLAGLAGWLLQRPSFDLRRVEVRGEGAAGLQHVSVHTVRAATAGRLDGNFFTMRLDEARRIFESVPWVAAVSLRRVWPDRLVVTVAEHRAIAVWDDGRLLADSGALFVANVAEAEVDAPLPQVDAPPRFAVEVAQRLPQLAARVASLGHGLEAVAVSDRASWTLRTERGLTLEVGRDDPPGRIDERLALIAGQYRIVAAHLGAEPLRIDARYPQGFAAAASHRKP